MGGIRLDYIQCCLELGEDEHLVTEREEAGAQPSATAADSPASRQHRRIVWTGVSLPYSADLTQSPSSTTMTLRPARASSRATTAPPAPDPAIRAVCVDPTLALRSA